MRGEGIEQCADAPPCVFDGSLCGFAQQMFELGEDLLDRIEVGAIWWQEQEARTSGPDRLPDGRSLVAGEIVHDDDVAFAKRRAELLLDPCGKADGVDRLIEDEGRVDPVAAQRGNEGHCLPVAVGHLGVEPLAFGRPAPQRSHVGLGPGLVDEDEATGIRPPLIFLPLLAPSSDLWSQLFGGKNAFFWGLSGIPCVGGHNG